MTQAMALDRIARATAVAPMHWFGALFVLAAASFGANVLLGGHLGIVGHALAIMGNATCGWSWLVVRATFRPRTQHGEIWPLASVGALVLVEAVTGNHQAPLSEVTRIVANLAGLASSAMLLLAAIEPLRGLHRGIGSVELRFRLLFFSTYAAILAIAVFWVNGAPVGSMAWTWGSQVKAVCALVALVGMMTAIWFRTLHPLPQAVRPKPRCDEPEDLALAQRIVALFAEESLHVRPDIRVATLARLTGSPEYKVTRSISGALGYRNFNQLVNHYRIAEAMRHLTAPDKRGLPILTIALDCGFGSIGPFNRAFKRHTGMTPQEYRRANC